MCCAAAPSVCCVDQGPGGDAEPTWHISRLSVGCCVGKGGPCSPFLTVEHRQALLSLWTLSRDLIIGF